MEPPKSKRSLERGMIWEIAGAGAADESAERSKGAS